MKTSQRLTSTTVYVGLGPDGMKIEITTDEKVGKPLRCTYSVLIQLITGKLYDESIALC